jgi:hypothetical protein
MPLQSSSYNLEPYPPHAEIWRFQPMKFFEDLMANEELYFNRADRFPQDENEGLLSEGYIRGVMRLQPYALDDEGTLINQIATLYQQREWFYVSCWHLHRSETIEMWDFAKDGVAIVSRYDLLKSVMNSMLDRTHLGLIRYGEEHLHGMNVLEFINTKQKRFAREREVRAILWCPDPVDALNRHIDRNNVPHYHPLPENPRHDWVHDFKRRRIDLEKLITGLVVSPWASQAVFDRVKQWVQVKGHSYEVRRSDLAIC